MDDRPPPKPIRTIPDPKPSYTRPDPKPLESQIVPPVEPKPVDRILAEITRMWPLLTERDRLELQGIAQLKVYLNTKK